VGGIFGTVAARGVDGNKAISSTAKAVVLGLGVLFCVLGLIGTAIYARRELTKIIMDEQNERAMEERAETEMAQSFMIGHSAISEEGDSCSSEDLENPELVNTSDDRSLSSSQSASPAKRYRKIYRGPWTPEIVASQLPILPKVLNLYCSPKKEHIDVGSDEPSSSESCDNCKQNRSTSIHDNIPDSVHSILDSDASTSSRYSRSHRQTVENQWSQNMGATSWSSVPRSSSLHSDDNSIHGLANMNATNSFSGCETSEKADAIQIFNPADFDNEDGIRRRCLTDPTDRGERCYESAPFSADAKKKQRPASSRRRSLSVSPSPQNNQRNNSPARSIDPSSALQMPPQHSSPRNDSLTRLMELGNDGVHSPRRSRSMTLSQQEEQPCLLRKRSISSHQLSPSTNHSELYVEQPSHGRRRSDSLTLANHTELNFGNKRNDSREDDGTGEPSREWFWIWA
jgi:hypothetical protein